MAYLKIDRTARGRGRERDKKKRERRRERKKDNREIVSNDESKIKLKIRRLKKRDGKR